MKTTDLLKVTLLAVVLMTIAASCSTSNKFVPQARSTVNSVRFSELNLERDDYEIMNTVTAEASITYTEKLGGGFEIAAQSGDFVLNFNGQTVKDYSGSKSTSLVLQSVEGVLRLGYLTNDDTNGDVTYLTQPEDLCRRLAIYRLINMSKEQGADGVIEPIISTNVEQVSKHSISFTTTVSAKLVKIKVK